MNISGVLSQLGSISGSLASLIIPGAANLPKLIEAGQKVVDSFSALKEANGGEAPAGAEDQHRVLVDKVNQHAESTFGRAEGGG